MRLRSRYYSLKIDVFMKRGKRFPGNRPLCPYWHLPVFHPLFLMLILIFSSVLLYAQPGGPGAVWSASVNLNTQNGCPEDTWSFDVEEAAGGELVLGGYVEGDFGFGPCGSDDNRVPGYAVVSKEGALVTSGYFKTGFGQFSQIKKLADGFVLAGHQNDAGIRKIFIVKLDNNFSVCWQSRYDAPGNEFVASVDAYVAADGKTNIIVTAGDNIAKCILGNNNCNPTFTWSHVSLSGYTGRIWDMKLVPEGAPTHVIFTGEKPITVAPIPVEQNKLNSSGNPITSGHEYEDFDVVVGKVPIGSFDPNEPNGGGFVNYYNSSKGFNTANTHAEVMPPFPISCSSAYGPCTPGKSVSGHPNCGGSPAVDYYLSKNSRDAGRSIVEKDGFLYVAVELKITVMTSAKYTGFHFSEPNGSPGAGVNLESCGGHHYHDYRDAYIYLMKINATTGVWQDAENVAHFSGGDYGPVLIVDQDGSLVLAGTTADKNMCGGLPDAPGAEGNMLIKIDPTDLSTIWQEHFLVGGEVEGTCAFGLIQTADGGYVIVGNQEDEDENETFNIIRFTPDCGIAFDLDGDYTLSGNETWNASTKPNPYRVRGNVIIPSGKKLTIDGIKVEFSNTRYGPSGSKSGITVQQRGRLALTNGATLTAVSCGGQQMWDGITVEGDPNSFSSSNQGIVYMLTGHPSIEYAQRGVVLGSTGWKFGDKTITDPINNVVNTVSTAAYNDNMGNGGGILFANSGHFLDCGKGVVWNPKKYSVAFNRLANVNFEFTGKLPDPFYMPSGDAPGAPVASELGCQLRSVPDVTFSNCTFINSANDNLFAGWRNRPTGVYATDSKISFGGGAANLNFDNLYLGIYADGAAGGLTTSFTASGHFSKVYQGIAVRGDVAPTISSCVFEQIPDKLDSDDGDPAGVFSKGTQGIGLINNQFYSNPAYAAFGALINNSLGTGGADMEFNTFGSFDIASRFEQDNSSIVTHCNTYNGDVQNSWDVSGSFKDQVNPSEPTYFPDNKFFSVCDNALLTDIKSDPSFSYYERVNPLPQSVDNTTLQCYTTTVSLIQGLGFPNSPNCVIEDPCPDPPNCTTLATKYNESGKELRYRNQLLRAYGIWDWSAAPDSNFLPPLQKGVTLLTGRNQQEDKRILAATHTALGNYSEAQTWLQQVSGTDAETQDFIQLYTMLIDAGLAGRDVYHLTAQDFASVSGQLPHTTATSEQVRALDHILNGRYHPLQAETSGGERSVSRPGGEEAKAPASALRVYPNPFNDFVRFEAPAGTTIVSLRITDIFGKSVHEWNDMAGEQALNWQAKPTTEGVFLYQCRLSNGETMQGKLLQLKAR